MTPEEKLRQFLSLYLIASVVDKGGSMPNVDYIIKYEHANLPKGDPALGQDLLPAVDPGVYNVFRSFLMTHPADGKDKLRSLSFIGRAASDSIWIDPPPHPDGKTLRDWVARLRANS
jgi:hypothetical protein